MNCGCRHSSDLMLLRLGHRPAAVAPTGPLAWKLPYAEGGPERKKKKKKQNNEKRRGKWKNQKEIKKYLELNEIRHTTLQNI